MNLSKLKVLFVYADRYCHCTFKRCFEVVNGLFRYHKDEIEASAIYYTRLEEIHFQMFNIIVFQRLGANEGLLLPSFKRNLEKWVHSYRKSCCFVYDIDDFIFTSQNNAPIWMAQLVDIALVPNEYLAEEMQKYQKCHVIRTHVDIDVCEEAKPIKLSPQEEIHIGWFSIAANGLEIFKTVIPLVSDLFHNRVNFHLYCNPVLHKHVKSKISHPKLSLYSLVSSQELYQLMKSMHCIVNPLSSQEVSLSQPNLEKENLNRFLQNKSEIKYALAGACQVPLIVTPIGSYLTIIQHQINGLLAKTDKEWIECLSTIIQNPSFAKTIAQAAYEDVKTHYSLQRACKNYLDFFRSLMLNKAAS